MRYPDARPAIALDVHGPGVRVEGEFNRWEAVLVNRQDDSDLVTVGLVVRPSPEPEAESAASRLFLFSSSRIERLADTAVVATGLFTAEENDPLVLRVGLDLCEEEEEEVLALTFALPLEEHSHRWWRSLLDGNVTAAWQLFPPEGGLN